MFSVDLNALERDPEAAALASIAPEDVLWEGAGFVLSGPVRAQAMGRLTASGQVFVEGTLDGMLEATCRRCMKEVSVPFSRGFSTFFESSGEVGADGERGAVREIPNGVATLDLRPVVREELMLHLPEYMLCRGDCAGLCAICGVDLNKETCTCTRSESDPRWDALRAATQ